MGAKAACLEGVQLSLFPETATTNELYYSLMDAARECHTNGKDHLAKKIEWVANSLSTSILIDGA